MADGRIQLSDGVPVFTGENFFRPGESVYIHMSSEYPDFVGVLHKHRFIEIVYVISGQAEHVAGNHRSSASKGDLFIVNYDTPHAFFADGNAGEAFNAYDLMFTPDFFDSSMIHGDSFEALGSSFLFYSLFPEEREFGPDLHLSGSSYNVFGELFNKIYLEYANREKGYVNLIRAYVVELIIKMFRKMDSLAGGRTPAKQRQIVDFALDYLRKNFNTRVTMEELAAKAFLSKDYFGRMFREAAGLPMSALLQRIRVEEACRLLASTDRTVADIAECCGFGDVKSFYGSFKKETGVTPGEYRNRSYRVSPR
jgi:AraC family L-rhamnose operon transcriptional activator RhaR